MGVNSVSLNFSTTPKYNSVNQTNATMSFSCSASLPSGSSSDTSSTSYSNLSYSWIFSDGKTASGSQGTHTFTGLNQGASNVLEATVKVSYSIKTGSRSWITSGYYEGEGEDKVWVDTSHWSDWSYSYSTGSFNSVSDSETVYTHPGAFEMGATSNSNSNYNIIKNVLTKNNIDKWIAHYQKAYHWLNQSSANYSADVLSVKVGDAVSATWFNKCLTAMKEFPNHDFDLVSGGPNGTIISADIINQLNFAGTGE